MICFIPFRNVPKNPALPISSMFTPESCRNQPIRFLQRGWFTILFLSLITAFSSLNVEAFAEDAIAASAPIDSQTKSIPKDKPDQSANAENQRSKTSTKKNADAANDSDKKAADANSESNEDATVNSAKMLNAIRKSYAKKSGADKSNDDLILSQSSAYIFLNRKKTRDIVENNLNYWYLSSFEDDFNLMRFVFDAIAVNPLVIDLGSDNELQLSLMDNDNSLMNYSETERALNAFINFPIPESVMKFISENSDDIVYKKPSRLVPESLSSYNYVVLFLLILGMSILGYAIYRIVVWAFLLDQNPDYDLQNRTEEDIVTPVNMDAYSAYFYQTHPEDKR